MGRIGGLFFSSSPAAAPSSHHHRGRVEVLPSEHGLQHVPQTGVLGVVVVHEVHEAVGVGDAGDDGTGLAALLVQVAPLLFPESESLVLKLVFFAKFKKIIFKIKLYVFDSNYVHAY